MAAQAALLLLLLQVLLALIGLLLLQLCQTHQRQLCVLLLLSSCQRQCQGRLLQGPANRPE
jgi:hypothetical protein